MTELLTPDLCILGGGSAGLSVAAAAVAFGVEVVLVEPGAMGGECLNTGCVPSKALIAAARHAATIREGARFGISVPEPVIDYPAVRAHVRRAIEAIAPHDSRARFEGLGVRVIAAPGRFTGPDEVVAGAWRIRARRFVLATGSSPAVPDVPGLAGCGYLTNETIWDLETLPSHLAILGAGPVGLELGQAFRRLGAAVTILDHGAPLSREEPEAAACVVTALREEGVTLRTGTRLAAVASGDEDALLLTLETDEGWQVLAVSHLLVAAGRRARVEGLGLEEAGIALERGAVRVDAHLATSNRRVYALGDVTGGLQLTSAASAAAESLVGTLLFRAPGRYRPGAVPRVLFTAPELAAVGMTEAEARAAGHPVSVLTSSYAENDRAQAEGETAGHVRLVVGRRGRLLGATIVGAAAGEAIAPYALMVQRRGTLAALRGLIPGYPTYAGVGKRAIVSYYAPLARSALVRLLVRFLALFG